MSDLISAVNDIVRPLGEELLPLFAKVDPITKEDGSWLTAADHQAHHVLSESLPNLVNLPVLSEEISEQEQLAIIKESQAGYWCVDPLDGTSNFTLGIPHWCISIGLVIESEIKLGVVYDPNLKELFAAVDDQPSTLNGHRIKNAPTEQLSDAIAMIDFKRIPGSIAQHLIHSNPYRSQRSYGASALDLCWIASDRCQLYFHAEQKLWDYVAGKKILLNAGGQCESFNGKEVFQNDLEPRSILAASSENLMQQWRDYIRSLSD